MPVFPAHKSRVRRLPGINSPRRRVLISPRVLSPRSIYTTVSFNLFVIRLIDSPHRNAETRVLGDSTVDAPPPFGGRIRSFAMFFNFTRRGRIIKREREKKKSSGAYNFASIDRLDFKINRKRNWISLERRIPCKSGSLERSA